MINRAGTMENVEINVNLGHWSALERLLQLQLIWNRLNSGRLQSGGYLSLK